MYYHIKEFICVSRSVPDPGISVSWTSSYISPQIRANTSSVLPDYFSAHSMTRLVSGSYYLTVVLSDSLYASGVFPLSFAFMDINSSSGLSNYWNNLSIPSDMDISRQSQYDGLIRFFSPQQVFWLLTRV